MSGLLIVCAASYLVGSIPNGLIIGKVFWGIDLREHGSHNIGATNAWRTIGKVPGIAVFLLDLLKGGFGVYMGMLIGGTPLSMVLGGIFAIIGHSCSIFLGFSGGKGVATGLGVIAMMMPVPALIVFAVWFIIVKITGYVSLGSIVAAALVPVLSFAFARPAEITAFGVIAAALVIFRHKANIVRLINGTESKIKSGNMERK